MHIIARSRELNGKTMAGFCCTVYVWWVSISRYQHSWRRAFAIRHHSITPKGSKHKDGHKSQSHYHLARMYLYSLKKFCPICFIAWLQPYLSHLVRVPNTLPQVIRAGNNMAAGPDCQYSYSNRMPDIRAHKRCFREQKQRDAYHKCNCPGFAQDSNFHLRVTCVNKRHTSC